MFGGENLHLKMVWSNSYTQRLGLPPANRMNRPTMIVDMRDVKSCEWDMGELEQSTCGKWGKKDMDGMEKGVGCLKFLDVQNPHQNKVKKKPQMKWEKRQTSFEPLPK